LVEKNIKLLWVAQGYLDAQIKKNYLLSYDIEAILYEESLGTLFGLTNTPLGEVEIYVKNAEYEKAILLLEDLQGQKGDF
jgi:hypothetical protein